MSEDQSTPPSLDDLDARLRKARERGAAPATQSDGDDALSRKSLGLAFRIGAELVAAMIIGVGGGMLLDRWLGTTPWGLIGMFFLGAGAGIVNVYRAVTGVGYAPGYRKPGSTDDGPEQ
ncbi:ATP synthase I [Skermanella stibiiresistens SB22]|uniref:ATP synthase protein I n=1 Tax=Skermanella stibiiresistens SB22 TaxID=1385369 RepID=W9H9P0_9PROT|nr:AtpZ/AtpI family protein [Skermanella stibiiresistens]EWY41422.1 ATP synthase I [Skermanella stibiiresistens SB22]